MTTVFESISDGFYAAFFQPDPEKRKEAIDAWIKESTPVIQSAVENDLKTYLEKLLEDTWVEKGWKARTEKYYGRSVRIGKRDELPFIDAYKVSLDVTIRLISPSKDIIVNPLTPEVRTKTSEAIEKAKWAIAGNETPTPVDMREINLHEDHTVEKAIPLIKEFLDECYRDNVRRVRIIHGKGIGVLRQAVRDYLEIHRYIVRESISFADNDHGGEGATEADLIEFSVSE